MALSKEKQQFMEDIAKLVQEIAPKYGYKVCSPIIAQAIHESGWGTSELAKKANNFFGLKYTDRAASEYYIKPATEQNADGSYYTYQNCKWCKYKTMREGIEGYFKFINVDRYKELKNTSDPMKYVEIIRKAGYATSLNYITNVQNVITSYNLTKYDNIKVSDIKQEQVIKPEVAEDTAAVPAYLYHVQIGAYIYENNAKSMKEKAKAAGFPCIIKEEGNYYKCQTGAFEIEANADKQIAELKRKGFSAIKVKKENKKSV